MKEAAKADITEIKKEEPKLAPSVAAAPPTMLMAPEIKKFIPLKRKLTKSGTCKDLNAKAQKIGIKDVKDDSVTNVDKLRLPSGFLSKLQRIRRVNGGNVHNEEKEVAKKVDTKKKWDCFRGLVKGAHHIFKAAREIQMYGYPNYDPKDLNKNSQILARSFLRKIEHTEHNIKKDKKMKLPWYVITPESKFSTAWTMILMVPIIYTVFVEPFNIAFRNDYSTTWWVTSESIVSFMYIMDIIVNFLSLRYNRDGTQLSPHKETVLEYIQGWFVIDIIASFPFHAMVVQGGEYEDADSIQALYPRFCCLLKMLKSIKPFRGEGKDSVSGLFKRVLDMNPGILCLYLFVIQF